MATMDNLKEAFAGESQANRKYLAFAQKAQSEGFPNIGRLFLAVAEAETIHALKHLNVMKGVGSTADNLKEAIAGEHHEFESMYPPFIAEAEKEGNQAARMSFHLANEVEKIHHQLYEKTLAALAEGKDISVTGFFVCPVCGYVEENQAPGRCPVCGAPGTSFKQI